MSELLYGFLYHFRHICKTVLSQSRIYPYPEGPLRYDIRIFKLPGRPVNAVVSSQAVEAWMLYEITGKQQPCLDSVGLKMIKHSGPVDALP